MSQTPDESTGPTDERSEVESQRHEMAEVDAQLDAESDGEGLGAEAGRGEETGLSEG